MKKKWIFGISILFLILVSCTLNARQEQKFSEQKSLYINAINEGSTLALVSMTYPSFVTHVKNQGTEHFKTIFGSALQRDSRLGSQIIQETVRSGKNIHILFQVEVENFTSSKSEKQFVGISADDGENWFFMPYPDYQNKQVCKELKRLIN